MPNLLQIMKQASIDANEERKPVNLVYGVVTRSTPIEIQVDQKLILKEPFLILSRNVTDYDVIMEVSHETEPAGGHSHSHSVTTSGGSGSTDTNTEAAHKHSYLGKKKYRVLNGLKAGEKVIMVRMQGGQRFIVLDRIG